MSATKEEESPLKLNETAKQDKTDISIYLS